MWVEVKYEETLLRGGDCYECGSANVCDCDNPRDLTTSVYHSVATGIHFFESTEDDDDFDFFPHQFRFRLPDDLRVGYVVWQRYGEGDTFSNSSGQFNAITVMSSLKNATALKVYLQARDNRIGFDPAFDDLSDSFDILDYHLEGFGYSGSVQGIYVMRFPIEGIPEKPFASPPVSQERFVPRIARLTRLLTRKG